MHDINGLIRHFADIINGIVIYDPKSLSTNAALIRCAANDGLITAGSTSMISFLTEELKISVAANLSTSNPYHEFVISKTSCIDENRTRGVNNRPRGLNMGQG